MGKIAIVFPGQGSQFVGMGKELNMEPLYDEANRILGIDIKTICFEGPENTLKETKNAQVAILIHSIACYKIFQKQGKYLPSVTAGHSVGEYSALVASEAISFEDALHLVRFRGELMSRAGAQTPGTMSAIIGLPADKIENIIAQMVRLRSTSFTTSRSPQVGGEKPVIANYNTPLQTVISGTPESVKSASELLKSAGAKVISLPVSGAFHSKLMEPAFAKFKLVLEKTEIKTPKFPIVPNVTAKMTSSPDEISSALKEQLLSPVRWVESVQNMIKYGVDTFIELGPGKVLTGLIKKIAPDIQIINWEP